MTDQSNVKKTTDAHIYYLLKETWRLMGHGQNAHTGYEVIRHFKDELKADPDNYELKLVCAEAQYRYGMHDTAATTFNWAVQMGKDTKTLEQVQALIERLKRGRPSGGVLEQVQTAIKGSKRGHPDGDGWNVLDIKKDKKEAKPEGPAPAKG